MRDKIKRSPAEGEFLFEIDEQLLTWNRKYLDAQAIPPPLTPVSKAYGRITERPPLPRR
jgi:hypothetical protein